ncbi:MAG: NifU family protein [Nitrospinaceae bacterium]
METKRTGFVVTATEPTPNPAAFKFNLNGKAAGSKSRAFNSAEDPAGDPFVEKLFDFGVVTAVLIHNRFVSVTLTSADEWEWCLDPILQCIQEDLVFYEDDVETAPPEEASILDQVDLSKFDELADVVKAEIIEVYMDDAIRPALAADGGGVVVHKVTGDLVSIRYQGACGSCGKSEAGTLSAIQSLLRKKLSPKLRVVVGREF